MNEDNKNKCEESKQGIIMLKQRRSTQQAIIENRVWIFASGGEEKIITKKKLIDKQGDLLRKWIRYLKTLMNVGYEWRYVEMAENGSSMPSSNSCREYFVLSSYWISWETYETPIYLS